MKDEATELGERGGKKKNLLPSMMCFLFRPLSVSALQQEGKEEVDIKGESTHMQMHAYACYGWNLIIKQACMTD